ncbi:MAG: hypothetical protein ABJL54_15815 [Halioglobus sp.]
MNLERLGSMHSNRLSFMRILLRTMSRQQWRVSHSLFELDEDGFGTVVYAIDTPSQRYSLVVFSNYLPDEKRNDRVIADQWDLTMALCDGDISESRMQELRENVPLQEAGRLDASVLVLSRANRSSRNFETVVGALAKGIQPSVEQLTRVGYLYRTTAVYGSGKMGMADWDKVRTRFPEFARPFTAEMFTCYLIRQFSIEQAEHIASHRSPGSAVPFEPQVKRYIGIGNATGLGMAPYLIKHPQLIEHWVSIRETALLRVLEQPGLDSAARRLLLHGLEKAVQHLAEICIEDSRQTLLNQKAAEELQGLGARLAADDSVVVPGEVFGQAQEAFCLESQEILASLLLELFPDMVDELADQMSVEESLGVDPVMSTKALLQTIESRYGWALEVDFTAPGAEQVFWYRSAEKLEPRLGENGVDPGSEWEMRMAVARSVVHCTTALREDIASHPDSTVARFLLRNPKQRPIVKRVQTMAGTERGEIQANLVDVEILPLHLLRCKLAFFGVSKFDPKSRLWVRNTMFQGAPLLEELGEQFEDDWYFPLAPSDCSPT